MCWWCVSGDKDTRVGPGSGVFLEGLRVGADLLASGKPSGSLLGKGLYKENVIRCTLIGVVEHTYPDLGLCSGDCVHGQTSLCSERLRLTDHLPPHSFVSWQ